MTSFILDPFRSIGELAAGIVRAARERRYAPEEVQEGHPTYEPGWTEKPGRRIKTLRETPAGAFRPRKGRLTGPR